MHDVERGSANASSGSAVQRAHATDVRSARLLIAAAKAAPGRSN